jgi:ABC-type lipoprotein export system ATPase subunit
VLADEPTASLDAASGQQIAEALRQVANEGRTVITVTHDEKLARLADQRLTMTAGRLA